MNSKNNVLSECLQFNLKSVTLNLEPIVPPPFYEVFKF